MMRTLNNGVRSESAKHVHLNIAAQQANGLFHDGHAWKDFARTALVGTRRAIH